MKPEFSIGIDIEEIKRIKRLTEKYGKRFLNRIFTKREIEHVYKKKNPYPSLTARFCAKEAAFKTIGKRVPWKSIEVISLPSGKPAIDIPHKKAIVSLSHTDMYAAAVVLAWND